MQQGYFQESSVGSFCPAAAHPSPTGSWLMRGSRGPPGQTGFAPRPLSGKAHRGLGRTRKGEQVPQRLGDVSSCVAGSGPFPHPAPFPNPPAARTPQPMQQTPRPTASPSLWAGAWAAPLRGCAKPGKLQAHPSVPPQDGIPRTTVIPSPAFAPLPLLGVPPILPPRSPCPGGLRLPPRSQGGSGHRCEQ